MHSFNLPLKYDYKVKKIEDELANKRHKSFPQEAKEKGIDDLVNHFGQFKNKKVYYNNENYERFKSCINEIKTTDVTKDKIKKLLKKLFCF